ncbi:MAG TPA: hypothetical protein VG142_13490 [Trebonia sp.]|nr:hypothetical protein [Trebonia sp.]
MDTRGLNPSAKQRARVVASAGLGQLDRWLERALTAVTADDVFKADDVVEETRAD